MEAEGDGGRGGRKGKDLIKDMVRRLKRDILVATNRLDALRPHN